MTWLAAKMYAQKKRVHLCQSPRTTTLSGLLAWLDKPAYYCILSTMENLHVHTECEAKDAV
jgi:hypothetical protein